MVCGSAGLQPNQSTVAFGLVIGATLLPNSSALVGANLLHQVVYPTATNAFGFLFSNGLRATIAGFTL